MAPCRTRTPAKRSEGGGRTYSGVCAAGQATGNPVFEAFWRVPRGSRSVDPWSYINGF